MKTATALFLVSLLSFASGIQLTPTERDAKVGKLIGKKNSVVGNCFFKDNKALIAKAEINVSWQIDDKGTPRNFKFTTKSPEGKKLFECFKKTVSTITFESAPKGQTFEIVEFPISIIANE